MIEFEIPGEPQSKARARTVHGENGARSFTPARTKEQQQRIALLFRQARGPGRPLAEVGFGVEVTFYRQDRQRRDVDNMAKLVLDALTGLAWVDDSQVTDLLARVRRDGRARTEVLVYTTDEYTPAPTAPCASEGCSVEVRVYPAQPRRFCGACAPGRGHGGRMYRAERPRCAYEPCGAEFVPDGKRARYCSRKCCNLDRTVDWECETCGHKARLPRSIAVNRRNCSKACRARQQTGAPRGAPRTAPARTP